MTGAESSDYWRQPMSEGQAGYEISQLQKEFENLTPQELEEIENALTTRAGSSIFFEEFSSPEAQEAAYKAAGMTYHPPEKPGYAGTWGWS
jgi:hypothetical protein